MRSSADQVESIKFFVRLYVQTQKSSKPGSTARQKVIPDHVFPSSRSSCSPALAMKAQNSYHKEYPGQSGCK
jgi:hypothetical protein